MSKAAEFSLPTAILGLAPLFSVIFLGLVQPVEARDNSGSWSGTVACSWGKSALNLTIDSRGAVNGKLVNALVFTGLTSGKTISFASKNPLNTASFTGRIAGNQMSGTYTQSLSQETCRWQANRTGGPAPEAKVSARQSLSYDPGKEPEPDYSKLEASKKRKALERDAELFLTLAKAAGQYCGYYSQMKAAQRYRQAEEAFRQLGNKKRMRTAAKMADAASAQADRCDANAAKAKTSKSAKKGEPDSCKVGRQEIVRLKKLGADVSGIARAMKKAGCKS